MVAADLFSRKGTSYVEGIYVRLVETPERANPASGQN